MNGYSAKGTYDHDCVGTVLRVFGFHARLSIQGLTILFTACIDRAEVHLTASRENIYCIVIMCEKFDCPAVADTKTKYTNCLVYVYNIGARLLCAYCTDGFRTRMDI